MVSLSVIILEILNDHAPQMVPSEEDHPIRDFSFEGTVEPLNVRVAVG